MKIPRDLSGELVAQSLVVQRLCGNSFKHEPQSPDMPDSALPAVYGVEKDAGTPL